MNAQFDLQKEFADRIRQAYATKKPLHLQSGNSKAFYGRPVSGEILALSHYQGIINYEPSELVITARAGTPLHVIEATLAEQGQMLGFEPPTYGSTASLGGTIACGLSGPRRPFSGAARDFVLGITLINGKGEILKFGGQVMKNVAGYDVSRLMCGAQGTLGVLLDITLKVVPMPAYEETRVLSATESQMQTLLSELGRKPLPLSATLLEDDRLYIRLSGARAGVKAAAQLIGGDQLDNTTAEHTWQQIKEQQHPFFNRARNDNRPLWRVSLAPATSAIPAQLADEQLIEWGGALRWIYSGDDNDGENDSLRQWAQQHNGHANQLRFDGPHDQFFQPLPSVLHRLSLRIKQSFDPAGILNPGRLYSDL